MAEQKRGISPAIIILPVGLGLGFVAVLGAFALARAAPPEVYTCPVCGDEFSILTDLQEHFTLTHPRAPIPIEWE